MNSYLQKAQLATIGFGSQWQLQGWIQLATDQPETQNDPPSFKLQKTKGLKKVQKKKKKENTLNQATPV